MSGTLTYRVPGIHRSHCRAAVEQEVVGAIDGVAAVEVDLDAKLVTVRGTDLDERALREAIDEAGYEPE